MTTTMLTPIEIAAFPALIAGIALILSIADRLNANFKDTALLILAALLVAAGATGIHALT